jgi:hypothetical protein
MIFGFDLVICDDFGDCHDMVVIAGIDMNDSQPICGHYLLGEGCSWALPTRKVTLVIDLIVDGYGEEIKD